MTISLLLAPVALIAASTVSAQTPDVQTEVAAVMADSAAGWNSGDLDRFVAIYADDAVYVTTKGLVRGKAEIAARYRPSFASGSNKRGRLSFQMLAYRTISNVHQLLFARWTLTPADPKAKAETGMTTLLFERRKAGWRIISDHSS
ncbi:MAG: SgcJ/EcaC family oxidoreductase [Sphingomonas bacterium]|nr:SgcJ/EcaC family oxidoreductase [Sphingomonas bacterium]